MPTAPLRQRPAWKALEQHYDQMSEPCKALSTKARTAAPAAGAATTGAAPGATTAPAAAAPAAPHTAPPAPAPAPDPVPALPNRSNGKLTA